MKLPFAKNTFLAFAFFLLALCPGSAVLALEVDSGEMQEIMVLRFSDVERLDSHDSELVQFMVDLHNQGTVRPPLQSIIGSSIKNPFFSGLAIDAWIEGILLAPTRPGPLSLVWIFPVDNQDSYLTTLMRQGLSDTEGVGDISIMSELDPDGNIKYYYLEWLPGNLAVFGTERHAVQSAREIYEAAGASRGLLGTMVGHEIAPDIKISFLPSRFAGWQHSETGVYWWRTQVERLVTDFIAFWRPEPARAKLMQSLAEDFASWPMAMSRLEFDIWFDEVGIEWRLRATAQGNESRPQSQLATIRHIPGNSAITYAMAVDAAMFRDMETLIGRLLLGAAGGVVPSGAKDVATSFADILRRASLTEASVAWISPPSSNPGLRSTRLTVSEWQNPGLLEAAWLVLESALNSEGPVQAALAQLGWDLQLQSIGDGQCRLTISPNDGNQSPRKNIFDSIFSARLSGRMLALAWGAVNDREPEMLKDHQLAIIADVFRPNPQGTANVRQAFTMVGSAGASTMIVFSPVTFIQMVLSEAADWRVLAMDEEEPLSTKVAREMYEYRDTGESWLMTGTRRQGISLVDGRLSWNSLKALAVSIGLTDNVGNRDFSDGEE